MEGRNEIADCDLQPLECRQPPFPASVCIGDGFDDTFAILSKTLVGTEKIKVLTEGLDRTREEKKFADAAIDHLTVRTGSASKFRAPGLSCPDPQSNGKTAAAARSCQLHGSDHFAIATDCVP